MDLPTDSSVPRPPPGLALGLRPGDVHEQPGPWLRWIGADGEPLPTGGERAERETERAEREKARGDREQARAEAAERRLAELEARLSR